MHASLPSLRGYSFFQTTGRHSFAIVGAGLLWSLVRIPIQGKDGMEPLPWYTAFGLSRRRIRRQLVSFVPLSPHCKTLERKA